MREVHLSAYNVPKFGVDVSAESKYGNRFWNSVESGEWEPQQVIDLCELGRPGDWLFIDIGASNGVYSLILGAFGNEVLAIEPDIEQFSALKTNLELNPSFRISAQRAIVGVANSLKLSPYSLDLKKNETSEIKVIDFKELFQKKGKRIIKIDIEGGEWQLFRSKGLMKLIATAGRTELFLSPHIGFFSEAYSRGRIHRLRYRLGILRELSTLYRVSRRANQCLYQGLPVSPFKLLRFDRILGGPGLKHHIRLEFGREG
jgi:FkbM family methyltransferase